MKKLTTLFALSALALTACTEEGTTQNPPQNTAQQQNPVINPFAPADSTVSQPSAPNDGTVTASPIEQTPVTTPVIQPPVEQPPITAPTTPDVTPPVSPPTGNLNAGDFVNGSNADTVSSFWICSDTGAVSPDEVTVLSFFADGNGIVGDQDTLEPMTWAGSGPYIELYIQGQYVGQLDNVSASASAGTLNASYVLSAGESGALNCELIDLDDTGSAGNTGGAAGEGGTVVTDGPVSTGGPVGTGTSSPTTLVNASSGDDLDTAWYCYLADGSELVMFFLAQGNGGLVSDNYPDGIEMTWQYSAQGVSINLTDGNQIAFGAPQFSGSDYFQVGSVNIQGASVAGMECELLNL